MNLKEINRIVESLNSKARVVVLLSFSTLRELLTMDEKYVYYFDAGNGIYDEDED